MTDYEVECEAVVNALVSSGINFLALDFDLTLISIHTRGQVHFYFIIHGRNRQLM